MTIFSTHREASPYEIEDQLLREILIGSRVPDVQLGILENDRVQIVRARELFARGRAVVLGIPGAFTPVCTKQHVPDFVKNADRLVLSGYSRLVCIAPNDPFVLAAFARVVDPENKINFLSDGNLDFVGALKLQTINRALFLGQRSERFLMFIENGIITKLRVEPNILSYSCSRPVDALDVEFV